MNNMQDVQTTVTVSAASAGWVSHLAGVNELLTTVATLVAIATGSWVLYDKWRARRGEPSEASKSGTNKSDSTSQSD